MQKRPGRTGSLRVVTSSSPAGESPAHGAPPPHVDMLVVHPRPVVMTGTALFALAFVVMLPFWNWLGDHGHRIWLWTALAGAVLGLIAFPLMRKHTDEGRLG